MKLKRSPRKLVEVLRSLIDKQMAIVVDIGLGMLVHFKSIEIPAVLAYELLDRFDQVTCSIRVEETRLHISEDDVYQPLGLPRGERVIEMSKRQSHGDFLDELAHVGGEDKHRMLSGCLKDQLLKDKEGGEWFRKVSLILMDTTLIAPTGDGFWSM